MGPAVTYPVQPRPVTHRHRLDLVYDVTRGLNQRPLHNVITLLAVSDRLSRCVVPKRIQRAQAETTLETPPSNPRCDLSAVHLDRI